MWIKLIKEKHQHKFFNQTTPFGKTSTKHGSPIVTYSYLVEKAEKTFSEFDYPLKISKNNLWVTIPEIVKNLQKSKIYHDPHFYRCGLDSLITIFNAYIWIHIYDTSRKVIGDKKAYKLADVASEQFLTNYK